MSEALVVKVDLGDRSYPIHIGPGVLGDADLIRPLVANRRCLIVTNSTVAPLYLDRMVRALRDTSLDSIILPDGEQYKTLGSAQLVYDRLIEGRFDRGCLLIALGGGVIGDLTGFVAATYQRGVRFLQVPTTLLAQVDSSVGGKTGVNHPMAKNMIGAFHQPECVLADTEVLGSLPLRELQAGFAEVLKYGLLGDRGFFDWLGDQRSSLLKLQPAVIAEAIRICCEHKAAIVAADERESGQRALLNLGHTFGHAIESGMGYGQWLHGEAVATGMVMAADLSMRIGWLRDADARKVKEVIAAFGLPVVPPPGIDVDRYLSIMSADKKVQDGRLRFILLRHLGQAAVVDDVDQTQLLETLRAGASLCER